VCSQAGLIDRFDGLAEVAGEGISGDNSVWAGLDLDGAVAAGGLDELADGPAGLVLDPPADRERREHDGQVRFDRVPGAVVDGPGLQVALGHPEALLDGLTRKLGPGWARGSEPWPERRQG
jgi:hypothetical protein